MLGGVKRHMLPHLPGVPHPHVNRPLVIYIIKHHGCVLSCFFGVADGYDLQMK